MNSGKVMYFNNTNGFGYIGDFEGREIYFHYTSIVDPEVKKHLTGGSIVYFDLFQTSIGWEASNVRTNP